MAFITIPSTDVDVKSPIDDALMGLIKDDLDDLDNRVITAGNSPFVWEVYGPLAYIRSYKRSLGYALVNKEFTPSVCRFILKKSGTSGTLAFDLRKHTAPNTAITAISHQYTAATQSIAQTGSAMNTQSIARTTPQISTQSIEHAKAAVNINSIINVGGNKWQYNLSATVDSDTVVGDSIVFASASNANNNGTFVITEINRANGTNVCVTNSLGVAQTGAAGSAQIKIMEYIFTNPVDSNFFTGESATFASHTSGANDGTFEIYAINQSGNNIWIKNPSGVLQAGVAGNANCNRWTFTFLSTVSTTNYVVDESAKMASHSSGGNNGNFPIKAVSGLTLVVYNTAGATQAGVAGTTNTNRWTYAMPSDPSADITAGDTVYFSGHTSANNDGVFTIKGVNSPSGNNLIIYNTSGIAQGGTTGSVYTTKKIVSFAADMSATYTTDSLVEMTGVASSLYNYADGRAPFEVLQVNRGGGANYNIVIDNPRAPAQDSPAGCVQIEMKSIFSTTPELESDPIGNSQNQLIAGTSTALVGTAISAQTAIMLYITEHQLGDPRDLTVIVA